MSWQCRFTLKAIFNKNLISFQAKDIYVVSRVIDGVFPDYKQIIPKANTTEVVILKQDLVNALKLSSLFSVNMIMFPTVRNVRATLKPICDM